MKKEPKKTKNPKAAATWNASYPEMPIQPGPNYDLTPSATASLLVAQRAAAAARPLRQLITNAFSGPYWIELTDNQVGYVQQGMKIIRYSHATYSVNRGEVFFLSPGRHYVENVPAGNDPYRETTINFSNQMMADAISALVSVYGIEVRKPQTGRLDPSIAHVNTQVWPEMQLFFESLFPYVNAEIATPEKPAISQEMLRLKLAEFAYMVLSHREYGMQHKILQCVDRISDPFEAIIRASVFEDLSLEELAARSNKSLTSFKNDFQRVFGDTPHRWIVKQRLLHARLLTVSTSKPISQIGFECKFDNTSHFIKLFKREFGITPLAMRKNKK